MAHNHTHTNTKIGWTITLNIIITVVEYIGSFMSGSLTLILCCFGEKEYL